MMKRVMLVFGTRPEAIKMIPILHELKKRAFCETLVCVTAQHREMLDQVLNLFNIHPDIDLNVMMDSQTIDYLTSSVLLKMTDVYKHYRPDLVLVHGDTTTTYASALAAFYQNISIGHVEAGLRTYRLDSPFPEEFNRQSVSLFAKVHFAPTVRAAENLLREGKSRESILITGNTSIDMLSLTVKANYTHPLLERLDKQRIVLLTAHRRENLGEAIHNMFRAIKRVLDEFYDVHIIYPIHLNPVIRMIAQKIFNDHPRLHIIEPLNVIDFHNVMAKSYLVLTDSGGIQEEAPSLGKPVLVMRETTERPEGIAAGTLKLVGVCEESIYDHFKRLLTDERLYETMSQAQNPYGDGQASLRIVDYIERYF